MFRMHTHLHTESTSKCRRQWRPGTRPICCSLTLLLVVFIIMRQTCEISVMIWALYCFPCPRASISSRNCLRSSISFKTMTTKHPWSQPHWLNTWFMWPVKFYPPSSNLSTSSSSLGCGWLGLGCCEVGAGSSSEPNAITFCSFTFSLEELYPVMVDHGEILAWKKALINPSVPGAGLPCKRRRASPSLVSQP